MISFPMQTQDKKKLEQPPWAPCFAVLSLLLSGAREKDWKHNNKQKECRFSFAAAILTGEGKSKFCHLDNKSQDIAQNQAIPQIIWYSKKDL